jgi:hypothetical protein
MNAVKCCSYVSVCAALLQHLLQLTHTLMNTVNPPTLSAVLMYIDVFIWCCNHLPIYPSIYTSQHSYTRTRAHLLRCTNSHELTRTRAAIRVSTLRNVPKIKRGDGVHYRAERRAEPRMQHVFNSTRHACWLVEHMLHP